MGEQTLDSGTNKSAPRAASEGSVLLRRPREAVKAAEAALAEAEAELKRRTEIADRAQKAAFDAPAQGAETLERMAIDRVLERDHARQRVELRQAALKQKRAELRSAEERHPPAASQAAALAEIFEADENLEAAVRGVLEGFARSEQVRLKHRATLGARHPMIAGFAVKNLAVADSRARLRRWLAEREREHKPRRPRPTPRAKRGKPEEPGPDAA